MATESTQARAQFTDLLRGSAVPTLAVGALGVLAGLPFGTAAAVSAGIGALLVVTFFALSLLVMRNTAHRPPQVVMGLVLASYTAKLLGLLVALVLLRQVDFISPRVLGISTICCTIVWLGCELRAFSRLRVPVTDLTVTNSSAVSPKP